MMVDIILKIRSGELHNLLKKGQGDAKTGPSKINRPNTDVGLEWLKALRVTSN